MKHAVLGAGAIGGIMATALGVIGEDVSLVVRSEKLAGYPAHLTLQQPTGTVTTPAHPIAKVSSPVDVLWIATKTYQLKSALDLVEAMPKLVIPLLNGIDHMAVLHERFSQDTVAAGAISVEAERVADGSFLQRSGVLLTVAGKAQPVLGDILASLQEQMGFVCRFVDHEETLLWTKLCFLAPFALVTSASQKNKGEIFADPEWSAKLQATVEEATAVATAEGAEVDAEKVRKGFEGFAPTVRSSMAKDLMAGRRLELEDIARPIVSGGERHGIPVPTTKQLVDAIRASAPQHSPSE